MQSMGTFFQPLLNNLISLLRLPYLKGVWWVNAQGYEYWEIINDCYEKWDS